MTIGQMLRDGNHADRKEVVLALEQGEAEVGRLSATLDRHILYFALLMDDGNVVRLLRKQRLSI